MVFHVTIEDETKYTSNHIIGRLKKKQGMANTLLGIPFLVNLLWIKNRMLTEGTDILLVMRYNTCIPLAVIHTILQLYVANSKSST